MQLPTPCSPSQPTLQPLNLPPRFTLITPQNRIQLSQRLQLPPAAHPPFDHQPRQVNSTMPFLFGRGNNTGPESVPRPIPYSRNAISCAAGPIHFQMLLAMSRRARMAASSSAVRRYLRGLSSRVWLVRWASLAPRQRLSCSVPKGLARTLSGLPFAG